MPGPDAPFAWLDEARAGAGAIVPIDHEGTRSVLWGLVRPEDRKSSGSEAGTQRERKSRTNGDLPGVLREKLSLCLAAALRVALARKAEVALLVIV